MYSRSLKIQGLLLLALLVLLGAAGAAGAADELVPLRLVALLNQDDQGEQIGYPLALHHDGWKDETYLISSTGRITIYNNKFFPIASFGQGRGLTSARGLTVDRQGIIYVCQEADDDGGRARLTVLNQAFFKIKEIFYDDIPELVGFTGFRVAVAQTGEIYLAGFHGNDTLTAAVVLDQDGRFLRFLRPGENDSLRPVAPPSPQEGAGQPAEPAGGSAGVTGAGDTPVPEAMEESEEGPPAGLPAGMRPAPASSSDFGPGEKTKRYPARISGVDIDENGRIYLLSREASHIYVYDAREKYLFKFGVKGGVESKLSTPVSLAVDIPRRTIYVCDYMRHTILSYDYDSGRYVYEFGGRGVGPLWFNFPSAIAVDDQGAVVVADQFNRRLQVINPNMAERRPLLGMAPLELAGALQPAAEAPKAPAPEPVPEPAQTAAAPAQMAAISPPALVAEQTLPPPVVPTVIAPASAPLATSLAAPAPALAPELPGEMAGLSGMGPAAAAPLQTPPPVAPPPAPKRLAPRSVKKSVPPPPRPELTLAQVAPLSNPAPLLVPAGVRLVPEKGAVGSSGLRRLMSMPAALGVYGPVAALLGIGSWLLYANN